MKQTPQEIALTCSRFSALVGADRHEMEKKLEELKAAPVGTRNGGKEYALRDLCKAFAGGDERAERIRKTRAESERIELQNSRTRGETIEVQLVKKLGEKVIIAIRQRILAFPITKDEQDELLLQLLSLRDLDWESEAQKPQ